MKRHYLSFLSAALSVAVPAAALAAWTGAPGNPPNSNANGPVWLQTGTPTAQTGNIGINGDQYFSTAKAIRADGSGITQFNAGNWGSGSNGFFLGLYGHLNMYPANGSTTAPILTMNGQSRLNVYQICLTGDTCRTTWPTGGGSYPGDIFVNTTGDSMTGQLVVGSTGSRVTGDGVQSHGTAAGIYATGNNDGGFFVGNGGSGVYGRGPTAGGYFEGANANSTGVYGSTVTGRGVDARATGSGDAVYANNSSNGAGGRFRSASGYGILSWSEATSGIGILAYNTATGVNAQAIVGIADNSVNGGNFSGSRGVAGYAANGTGVYGYASNQKGPGVYGYGFYGAQGDGLTGVRGDGTAAYGGEFRGPVAGIYGLGTGSAGTAGVYGDNTVSGGYGVYGRSSVAGAGSGTAGHFTNTTNGPAIWAEVTGGGPTAVYAVANVTNGVGLNGSGNSYGVWGQSASANGTGVQGSASGSNGTGVYGSGTAYSFIGAQGRFRQIGNTTGNNSYLFIGDVGCSGYAGIQISQSTSPTFNCQNHALVSNGNATAVNAPPGSQVDLTVGNTVAARFNLTSPNAYKSGGGSWGSISDARLKDLHGSFDRGLDELEKIDTVYFTYNGKSDLTKGDKSMHVGVVAQDVLDVIPEAVTKDQDGYYIVNNDPIIWTMLNSIKELKTENDTLKTQINDLNARLEKLEKAAQ